MSERKTHTIYQAQAGQYAGVRLSRGKDGKGGAASFTLHAADLNGEAPRKGDRLQDDAGNWYEVEEVGAPDGGAYPLACKPAKGGR